MTTTASVSEISAALPDAVAAYRACVLAARHAHAVRLATESLTQPPATVTLAERRRIEDAAAPLFDALAERERAAAAAWEAFRPVLGDAGMTRLANAVDAEGQ